MTPLSVRDAHEAVRRHLEAVLRRAGLAWVGVTLAVAMLLAWLLVGAEGWSPGSPVPLVLDVLLLVSLTAGVASLARWRRRSLSEARVARAMEESAGLEEGTVRGSLELSRSVPPGVSTSLVGKGEQAVLQHLHGPPPRLGGDPGRRLATWWSRGLRALALLAPLVVAAAVLAPARTASAVSGLGSPIRVLSGPVLPPLEVTPGSVEVPRGAPLEIRVRARARERVTLHWQAAGDVARSRELEVRDGEALHGFPQVAAALEYWVAAPDGARSPVYVATPVDPLFVTDVTLRLEFPVHTGRVPEEYRGEAPPLEIPVGTRIEVDGVGSRPLGGAGLVPVDEEGTAAGEEVGFEVSGAAFAGSFVPRRSGTWRWRFVDDEGAPAELAPTALEITLLPDLPPTVQITFPGRDTVLPLNLRQPLVIQAADDYGVAELELVAWRVTALGEPGEPVRQRVDLGGSAGILARPVMDVSDWGLLPGDQVRYYVRVTDNAPGAQEASTPEYVLRMPDAAALRRGAQRQMEDAAGELEELTERARRAAEETRTMERQARAPDRDDEERPFQPPSQGDEQVGFEEREDLRGALEEQEAMASRVDSLRRELEELSSTLQDAGAQDPELRSDLDELQELLEEVAGPELRERMRRLAEEMDEMDRQRAREALEELAAEEERFRERLEEALDRMRRAAVEQDFRATTEEAEELARQEEALAEAMEEGGDLEARARQQDELTADAQAMQERMERLQERLQELGEEDAARTTAEASETSREAMEAMQQAAGQARQQQGAQAGERAGQASRQMSEAARQLQEAQQQMMQQRAEALAQALQQTTQDALSLARRQGELQETMRGASQEELADMRAEVAAVEQGVRNMAENLSVAARAAGASMGDRQVGEAMGQAMAALEETVGALDRPSTPGRSPVSSAEQAVDALNRVALSSMAAAQQLSQGGEGTATEQMLEALERLAQEQADVNNQASQLMPMQLSPRAMQQQMQQMSEGQQSVASDLGELSNQEGEEGALGDLEALAREAEALARELAQGRLEPEVRERQERLFHRLLDAGRSLEKDEYSEERESEAPGTFERGEVAPLDRDALGLLRFRTPDAEALRRLPPAARALVLQYFQRLNRGAVDAGGGGGS